MRNAMAPPDYEAPSGEQYQAPPPQYYQNRQMESPPRRQGPPPMQRQGPPMQRQGPPPMQRQGPPPMQRQQSQQGPPDYDMWSDQSDDEDFDYGYDDYNQGYYNSPPPQQKNVWKSKKPSNKGKCAGKRYSMVPIVVYLIVVGLSFFGLLLSKQSMFGNIGLIVIQLIITFLVGGIIYYLTVRCQTVAAMVVLVIALIVQLLLVAGAGIWFII
jgi:hypothetical protein